MAGGNRRSRQQQQQQQHQQQGSSSSLGGNSNSKRNTVCGGGHTNSNSVAAADQCHRLSLVMMEPYDGDGSNQEDAAGHYSFAPFWNGSQLLFLLYSILYLVVSAVIVGFASGMVISIHYYQQQSPVAAVVSGNNDKLNPQLLYSSYYWSSGRVAAAATTSSKVTLLDAEIAASNVLRHHHHKDAATTAGGSDVSFDLGKVITTTDSGQLEVLLVVQEETPIHADTFRSASTVNSRIGGGQWGYYETVLPPPLSPEKISQQQSATAETYPDGNGDQFVNNDDNSGNTLSLEEINGTPLTLDEAERLLPGYKDYIKRQPDWGIQERVKLLLPILCSDGVTYGYKEWNTLRAAIQEANYLAAERFMRWNEYFATHVFTAFEDDSLYYEQDVVFTICPHTTLKSSHRKSSITINSENIVLQCDGCIIDVRGTHITFGANARNVLVRGVTFRSASTSSLTFFNDGAEATFQDCTWINNLASNPQWGSVADINSTSMVNFHRCEIGFDKHHPHGRGVVGMVTSWWNWLLGTPRATKSTNSVSIRTKEV